MTTANVSLKGWTLFQRNRRRALRAGGFGISLCRATRFALHEARCRAQIAEVLGKRTARTIELLACEGSSADSPQFVMVDPLGQENWDLLCSIPNLLRPVEV